MRFASITAAHSPLSKPATVSIMSATDRTTPPNALELPAASDTQVLSARPPAKARQRESRSLLKRAPLQYLALTAILALSAVLNTHRLAQNGYANTFYSAGVKSMLKSWHNFFFVSFDPGGLVSIDKPPLGVWTQVLSAKLFGFSPLSLLLPEAIISTIAVAVLYRLLARRLGTAAALAGALALAVFPSFVAVSRDNGVDPLLILLMILACGAALNAIEDGRRRWLISCAVLIALAFNTKTLAAYLIVPGIALAYLTCAPGAWYRRVGMLFVAGVIMAIGSFLWIAVVELTPASQRPYVGSSTNNTELGLTFDYNGFGRVEGEVGGPGQVPVAEGAVVRTTAPPAVHRRPAPQLLSGNPAAPRPIATNPLTPRPSADHHVVPRPVVKPSLSAYLPNGRLRNPISFGGATGPLRLFESRLADQGSWMLPFALMGLLAFGLLMLAGERTRRNPRLAMLIVLGGWLLVELAILDFSKGIIHPYYISAVGPSAAAMIGAGAVAFARFAQRRDWCVVLLPCAVAATVAAQVSILDYQHYMRWFVPVLIVGTLIGLVAIMVRRFAGPAMAFVLCLLLVAPTAYASTTWLASVQGTFAAAGPHQASGDGGFGVNAGDLRFDRSLLSYVNTHRPGTRWSVLTVAAPTAAPMILLGSHAGALAGYSGTDPVLDGPGLARLVASGQARYVVIGGAYASRGGNLASKAVLRACLQVPAEAWHGPVPSRYELVLFDCAGRERALSRGARVG
jgi:4-amino-4-deoxy-L-arabinose transferase-like glycosyltransferase